MFGRQNLILKDQFDEYRKGLVLRPLPALMLSEDVVVAYKTM